MSFIFRTLSIDMAQATYHTISDATRDDRLIFGVEASAKYMMADPEGVFACILPKDGYTRDTNTKIYYTLLEAYCNQVDIPLIPVDCGSKLLNLINENSRGECGSMKCPHDCSVILIRKPNPEEFTMVSEYEKDMANFIDVCQQNRRQIPLIVLPDSVH